MNRAVPAALVVLAAALAVAAVVGVVRLSPWTLAGWPATWVALLASWLVVRRRPA